MLTAARTWAILPRSGFTSTLSCNSPGGEGACPLADTGGTVVLADDKGRQGHGPRLCVGYQRQLETLCACAGGNAVPPVIGSRPAYLRAGIGGFQGCALMPGDELPLGETRGKSHLKRISKGLLPEHKHDQTLRIISGPEAHYFEIAGLCSFLSAELLSQPKATECATGFQMSQSGRKKEGKTGINSAGISLGTIQIPSDSQPIILMADRQNSGGYARIANVITVDLTILAQMQPGDMVRFQETTMFRAQ